MTAEVRGAPTVPAWAAPRTGHPVPRPRALPSTRSAPMLELASPTADLEGRQMGTELADRLLPRLQFAPAAPLHCGKRWTENLDGWVITYVCTVPTGQEHTRCVAHDPTGAVVREAPELDADPPAPTPRPRKKRVQKIAIEAAPAEKSTKESA